MIKDRLNSPEYFIFGNKPTGEYQGSIWDTENILETKEYYFVDSMKLAHRPKKGDVVVFKEFGNKIFWGEAILDSAKEEINHGNDTVIRFKLKAIKKWFYSLRAGRVQHQLSSQATRNRIISITKKDYILMKEEMEKSNVLSEERQQQIKDLWHKYKADIRPEELIAIKSQSDTLAAEWQQYRTKIADTTLSLDDYTNVKNNDTAKMPGYYLCNFLERGTRNLLGSSKPGNAENFEVKLNSDRTTYYIRSQKNHTADRPSAETFFSEQIKPLFKSLLDQQQPEAKSHLIRSSTYSAKQILMKFAVLENPSDYLFIYAEQVIDQLYDELICGEEEDRFLKSHQICTLAKRLLEISDEDRVELILLSRFLWKYATTSVLADKDNPNVIIYGPPGTGKTYSVINSLDFVCQGDSSRYEQVQFHPSFTYEDFIEGIKPKGVSKDGNIRFELVNGVFKNFCKRARQQPNKSYYFVVDEINRANLSAVFGETLSLLEKDYRHDVSLPASTKNLISTQYSALIEDLIKEDEKYIELSYFMDNNSAKFGVPSNLFFVGMMNDVDKSIDAFDLALRRRFKWIRKDCNYDVIEEETKFRGRDEFHNIGSYRRACEHLNGYIANQLGLGKSYEFGHSFFMKMSHIAKRREITHANLDTLFNLYLRPTLREYLRAIYPEAELDRKLIDAQGIFKHAIR
ncbi:McrB family protein [Pedobacter sp.]|uniref:McrB family protein n=1 Tax=Pedobacter sp. TaxID=1411316 RepID=UPI003C473C9F